MTRRDALKAIAAPVVVLAAGAPLVPVAAPLTTFSGYVSVAVPFPGEGAIIMAPGAEGHFPVVRDDFLLVDGEVYRTVQVVTSEGDRVIRWELAE